MKCICKANVCGLDLRCDISKFCVGNEVAFVVNGIRVERRKVRDCKDGMYVQINGTRIFYEDFE